MKKVNHSENRELKLVNLKAGFSISFEDVLSHKFHILRQNL